jgi:hypothetical protein
MKPIKFAAIILSAMGLSPTLAQEDASVPLYAVAGAARYRLSASTDMLYSQMDAGSRAAFAQTLKGISADGGSWPNIMAGAMQVRHETGDKAETLWFNPLFDAGLIVHWTKSADGWSAVSSAAILGEDIRRDGSLATSAIGFVKSPDAVAGSLFASANGTLNAAQRFEWTGYGGNPKSSKMIIDRTNNAESRLMSVRLTKGYGDFRNALRRMLVSDDPAKQGLPPSVQSELRTMGESARQTLRAISAYRRTEGWSVMLQSPDAPGITWIAHFTDPAGGESAQPAGFSIVDYTKPEVQK